MLKVIADALGFSVAKLLIVSVLALGGITAGTAAYFSWKSSIQDAERRKIEDANRDRLDKGNAGEIDVTTCFARDGTWDRSKRQCVLP